MAAALACALAPAGPGAFAVAQAAGLSEALANADGWAAQPPGRERDRILERWAAGAPLADLVYVLRRGPELGVIEVTLVRQALERTPRDRAALRRRLLARLALVDPRRARSRAADLAALAAKPVLRPRASAFRVAALLPDTGSYAGFSAAVRAGFEAGLADGGLPIETIAWDSGEDAPPAALAALDSASATCGILLGELLSEPTLAIAAAARVLGLPLVSPTATDEQIGSIGPAVFQVGPSAYTRGRVLGESVIRDGRRAGILLASDANPAFAEGFAAAARTAGADVVLRRTYAASGSNFRDEVRALADARIDVLFWDGRTSEAEPLLREMARQKLSLRIGGGTALAPPRFHGNARFLLEGVEYVDEEWRLSPETRAVLDEALAARGAGPADPQHVRGYLAGRMVRAAIAGGALCPEEVTAYLAAHLAPEPWLKRHGFLAFDLPGLTIPVYRVERGRAVQAER